MDDRVQPGRRRAQQGDGLGDPVHRPPPFGLEQQQDARDQDAAAGHADPPIVAGDVQRPDDGVVVVPDPDALVEQVSEGEGEEPE